MSVSGELRPSLAGLGIEEHGDSFHSDAMIRSPADNESRAQEVFSDSYSSRNVQHAGRSRRDTMREPSTLMVSSSKMRNTSLPKNRPGFFKRLFSSSSTNESVWNDNGQQLPSNESLDRNDESLRHKASVLFRRPNTASSTLGRATFKTDEGQRRSTKNSLEMSASVPAVPTIDLEGHGQVGGRPIMQITGPSSVQGSRTSSSGILTEPGLSSSDLRSLAPAQQALLRSPASPSTLPRLSIGNRDSSFKGNASSRSYSNDNTTLQKSSAHEAPVLPQVSYGSPLGSIDVNSGPSGQTGPMNPAMSLLQSRERSSSLSSDAQDSPILGNLDDFDLPMEFVVKAKAIYEWQDHTMPPEDYAKFLGREEIYSEGVREAYMNLFDFTNMSILKGLRLLCTRLHIKGETQVIDRIIETFSRRWRKCNASDRYLTEDVTYIIAFALITLNTDFYVANMESDQKMKRLAFVQNTIRALRTGSKTITYESKTPTWQSPSLGTPTSELTQEQTIRFVPRSTSSNTLEAIGHPSVVRNPSEELVTAQAILAQTPPETTSNAPGLSRKMSKRATPHFTDERSSALGFQARDVYLREILSDMYLGVKSEQIRQPQSQSTLRPSSAPRSMSSRKSSIHEALLGSNGSERMIASSGHGSVNSTDPNGEPSPALSAALLFLGRSSNTIYNSNQESRLSIASRSSLTPHAQTRNQNVTVQRGIGFAGSLNNVIIREEKALPIKDEADVARVIEEAEEDKLTLFGAPFAKEGRMHLKTIEMVPNRKAKHKHWSSELFAVLERGRIKLFDFPTKATKNSQTTFGGGNWTQSARSVLDIDLVQTVASATPVGRISRDRPFVWVLTMPNNDEHLFEVGTEELIEEWVSTANYWAARATKEPLLGAVGSTDFGWGRCIEDLVSVEDAMAEQTSTSADLTQRSRPSTSGRSEVTSITAASGTGSRSSEAQSRYPGNTANIRDWHPDPAPIIASTLSQDAQLLALERFLTKLGAELESHTAKRPLILQAFSHRHPNQMRALSNFDRRREYLSSEMKKYRLYTDALKHGITIAQTIQSEREDRNLKELQPT